MGAPSAPAAGHRPQSLTEWLRGRSDVQLATILRRRPDLALPAPADLSTLAARMSVRTSIQRALDGLDAFALRVLESLLLVAEGAHGSALDEAARWFDDLDPDDFARGVAELTELGLVWGAGPLVHPTGTVREAVGPYPAGLGRPAAQLLVQVPAGALAPVLRSLSLDPVGQPRAGQRVAAELADPARLAELVAACDPSEREVLDRLSVGPPIGVVRNAYGSAADSEPTPPHRLLARGLLIPVDAQTAELPREVGLHLRGGTLGSIAARPPTLDVVEHAPDELDRIGTTAILETLRLVAALGEAWGLHGPHELRAGGVGARDLRRTARDLGVDESTVALIAETAVAAGLLNSTNGPEPVYLPTEAFDTWLVRSPAARWAELALAWLEMTRQPSLVNQRGDRDRLITVLSPDVERGTLPAVRAQVLDALAELPPGAAPASHEEVLRSLAWHGPRRATAQRTLAGAVLAEADLLGITAGGGLTGYSRTLRAGSRAVAEHVLAGALPAPVDHFLVQPDLTLVVPGPPTPELAAELGLAADLESTGGANVYRITETSVRRALDAGRSGAELSALIAGRSRTPVPQALQYLIEDAARRHGVLRSGAAACYLRCDDEQLLSRVLADRDVASAQLRRIAPTVLISPLPINRILEVLRAAGYAPAAEAPDGELISLDAEAPRAPSRPVRRPIRSRGIIGDAQRLDLVRRIRAGEALTEVTRRVQPTGQVTPGVTSAATMGVLREAIREGRRVLLGCAEPDGTASRHTILPISMAAGYVRGHEPDTTHLQSFPLHRLTAVSVIDDDESG